MGRTPCCEKVGLKKGPWTAEEDHKLVSYIEQNGHGSWRTLPPKADFIETTDPTNLTDTGSKSAPKTGIQRCGKSCRLRWTNYLRPDIKRGKFNVQEEQTIIQLHALLGNRWSVIATHLPKRTDNEIKNYWNTHIKKMLTKMGIDPITHRRRISAFGIGPDKNAANLSHMAQWENARLEAEARLEREAKLASTVPNLLARNNSSTTHFVDKSTLSRPIRPQPLCLDVLKTWQGIMSSNVSNGIPLESPTSTLNFSDNTTTIPNVGFLDNFVPGMPYQGLIMKQNIQNDTNILDFNAVPQAMKEKMENSTELDEMVYTNNAFPILMDGFIDLIDVAGNTQNLTDVAGNTQNLTENNNLDLEENWINILNNLANSSPLRSPAF